MTTPSSSVETAIIASGATLTAEIYPHLLALVPELSKVAPASVLAWISTSKSPQEQVHVHIFKADAIPPAPQYSKDAHFNVGDAQNQVSGNTGAPASLPDARALVVTVTFTGAFTTQEPIVLGPAAPAVPLHLQVNNGKGRNKARKTTQALPRQEHVRSAYMWCEKQAATQGKLLPWPASAAPLAQEAAKPKYNKNLLKDRLMRIFYFF